MTQDKLKRVVTAVTVAATALLVFLLSYIVYQVIHICVLNAREKELMEDNKRLEETIAKEKLDAEYYESQIGQEWLAFEWGWFKTQGD